MSKNEHFLKKILVPVDQSDSSLMAQETAVAVAKKTGAKIMVLHVIPQSLALEEFQTAFPATLIPIHSNVKGEIMDSIQRQAENLTTNALYLFSEEGIKTSTEISRNNDPADEILDFADKGYDLIIMGAHGEHEKNPYALGSVTKKVIMHMNCPTLIAKEVSILSKILVCIDGSEQSMKALEFTSSLAGKMGSNITLLNVQEPRLRDASLQLARELGDRILSKASETLREKKVKAEKIVEYGVPSETIPAVAENGGYDLIVLASRGLGRARRFLLGSVTDDVSHKAKSSVLICPTKK